MEVKIATKIRREKNENCVEFSFHSISGWSIFFANNQQYFLALGCSYLPPTCPSNWTHFGDMGSLFMDVVTRSNAIFAQRICLDSGDIYHLKPTCRTPRKDVEPCKNVAPKVQREAFAAVEGC